MSTCYEDVRRYCETCRRTTNQIKEDDLLICTQCDTCFKEEDDEII